MKISVYALAQEIKVPRSRVNDITLGRRGNKRWHGIPVGALFQQHGGFLEKALDLDVPVHLQQLADEVIE